MVGLSRIKEKRPKVNVYRKSSVTINKERFAIAIFGRGPYYGTASQWVDIIECEVILWPAAWGCQYSSAWASFGRTVVRKPTVREDFDTFDRRVMLWTGKRIKTTWTAWTKKMRRKIKNDSGDKNFKAVTASLRIIFCDHQQFTRFKGHVLCFLN